MANHMVEVAKMLGVDPGERFKIIDNQTGCELLHSCYFSYEGIAADANVSSCFGERVLMNLINGKYSIKPIPWKPKENEYYYSVEIDGRITRSRFSDTSEFGSCHKNYYKLGNCYCTKEEAEANRDKWVKFYESDEVLEV